MSDEHTITTTELRSLANSVSASSEHERAEVNRVEVTNSLRRAAVTIERYAMENADLRDREQDRVKMLNESCERMATAEKLADDRLSALLAAAELAGQLVREVRGD